MGTLGLAILLAALGAAVVAAEPSPAAPAGVVRFMTAGNPAEEAAYASLIAAFEAANPAIDVVQEHVADDGDYLQRVAADQAAGTPADVILLNYRRFASFAARGALEPLGPRVGRSPVLDAADFAAPAYDAFRWRGELQCVPQNVSSLVVYLNRDRFEEAGVPLPSAGWTWGDLLAAATALTSDDDGDGTIDRYGFGSDPTLIRIAPFIWQHGGQLVAPGEPRRLLLDSPAAAEAIRWFVELQTVHHVAPDAIAVEARDLQSRFVDGTLAMFLQSRRPVPALRGITGFTWDVAPLPVDRQEATILHADAACLTAGAGNPEAGWRLIEFATSAAGQAIMAGTGRTVPSNLEVAASPAFLDPSQAPASAQVWLDAIPSIRTAPVLPEWLEIEELADAILEQAYYGTIPVDAAIASIIEQTTPRFAGEG